ncbi:MAG: hypothetical protein M1838_000599 [Thelocarpon superellum]|nr:MAG: hypothetical protein M1838_000599 [Thelocarpon superellum]
MGDLRPADQHALSVTIRFTNSLPDLSLLIAEPSITSIIALKRLIRTRLPPDEASRHLRLIHGGKALLDPSPLSALLRHAPPLVPGPSGRVPDGAARPDTAKGKGKARMEDAAPTAPAPVPLYVHCSIGDPLSAATLAAEASLAEHTDTIPIPIPGPYSTSPSTDDYGSNTTPAPAGFDRLLAMGFSAAEVASLRAQFLAVQARAYTPDTMPTVAEMRLLEDRWIDESVTGVGDVGFGGATGPGAGSSTYEDMLVGNILGFFWPLGALVWLLREEGVWNGRRQMSVFSGFMVNLAFSVLRAVISG